jgi:hypothetical protein
MPTFSYTIPAGFTGQIPYFCFPHCRMGMTGLIIVQQSPPADFNHDGHVGPADLAQLLATWGRCPAPPATCPTDLTHDNVVGPADLAQLLATWG